MPPQQQEAFGQPCKAGFHSHRSPQGKELVLFQAEQLVPMFVLTLAGGEHVSAADRAAAAAVAAAAPEEEQPDGAGGGAGGGGGGGVFFAPGDYTQALA